jgi:hypothetical protein
MEQETVHFVTVGSALEIVDQWGKRLNFLPDD